MMTSGRAGDGRSPVDPRRIVAELGELADAAALDPRHWESFFGGLQRLVPDSRIAFQAHDEALAQPLPLVTLGWDAPSLDAYVRHYAAINPWIPSWVGMPTLASVRSDWHIRSDEFRRTEFFNDWLKPIGGAEFATAMKLVHGQGRLAQFAVHYDIRRAEQIHGPLSLILDRLAPRLRRALDCNRVSFRPLDVVKDSPLMETLIDPAFLVDAERRLYEANGAATALLDSRFPFRLCRLDVLSGIDPEIDARLGRAVSRTCSPTLHCGGGDFTIDRPARRLTVVALPVAPNLGSLTFRGPASLFVPRTLALLVVRPLPAAAPDIEGALQSRFRLTAAEARVVLALRGGGSMVDIADRLGLQYETARAHLKSAFAKTKTHSQREMLALLLQLSNGQSGS